ncbi:MAG: GNAT family N-acetyltransferase [Acidobacteriaceae bacterium]|nr:GNAT family N-acetyltransferase [Acidobacteriaceae bacterium]
MKTTRATVADAALIAAHRKAMFEAMGRGDAESLERMRQASVRWLETMMGAGRYLGWMTREGEVAVASAGLLILDWSPHPGEPESNERGYLMNVFVEAAYRGRGLAKALVRECMEEAQRRGLGVVALHASDAGRPLYERLGFSASNEMLWRRSGT